MIRNNIILLYCIYIVVIVILCIIDTSIILYYLFWILNVFIYPLFWLILKILFFNRALLLLLLFYYILAKYTIEIPGYKYFTFFGVDVKQFREIYLDYLFRITAYHIEILSIFMFFIVILLPFFFNNEIIIGLIGFFLIFFFVILKVFKKRLDDLKRKPLTLGNWCVTFFLIFVMFKITTYQHYKDIFTLCFYFDEWLLNFLDLKIKMYKEPIVKEYFTFFYKSPKEKPVWVIEKENIRGKYYEREWNKIFFFKKEVKLFFKSLKNKVIEMKEDIGYNYELYFKNLNYFASKYVLDLINLKKSIFVKNKVYFKNDYKKDLRYWNFKKKQTGISFEKEIEYYSQKTIINKDYLPYSFYNYYKLNNLLEYLTIKKGVFNESFFDKRIEDAYKQKYKKNIFFTFLKQTFKFKDTVDLLKNVLYKIKKNKQNMLNKRTEIRYSPFFYKFFDYLLIKENTYKKKEYTIIVILNKINKKISNERNFEKVDFVKTYNKALLKHERNITLKGTTILKFPEYIKRDDLEKNDNKLLLNTVNKYQKEKVHIKHKWRAGERTSTLVLKKNQKTDLVVNPGPDLSRRDNK